ncbi:MAG: SurA N-terminal domain-containing protein [Candidatus Krumholzibacteria bacterium]|nr:SurA N-terminal domain-containing protein [Candidatus Krumholzibacteria bacterium]
MLQKMRQNTKIILWIVVVSFVITIFAVWGLDLQVGDQTSDPNVIGTVNKVPITRSQYQFAYEQFAQQVRSAAQGNLTYSQERFIRNQAWDSIVYGILTEQEIARLGITVTDEEIVAYLRNSPPIEIRQYFLDDQGNFDNQAYQTALNNPEIDWTNLEQLARERIPRMKLNEYLAAQVHVSEHEIRRAYDRDNVDLSIAYVEFSIGNEDVGDYEPSDAELQQYYDANSGDFVEAAQTRLKIVKIPLSPSPADLDDALYTVNRVRDQILAGEEFAVLAKTYSEAPTSVVDGNTGFMKRDQRDEAYFAALDSMQVGELSGPIETESGFYLLKLVDKREAKADQGEYSVQEILISAMLSRQTSDSLFALASDVRARALAVGLEEAATEKELAVDVPGPFFESSPIEGIGFSEPLNKFGFASEPSAISDVLQDDKNVYVAEVAERVAERTKPLDEVRQLVRSRVIYEAKKTAAHKKAKAFHQKATATDFQAALETYDYVSKETGTFRAGDALDGFGSNSTIAEAALALAPAQTSPPLEWRNVYVVFTLLSRSQTEPSDYESKISDIRQQLLGQKAQVFTQSWYENLRAQSKIEDYRTQG